MNLLIPSNSVIPNLTLYPESDNLDCETLVGFMKCNIPLSYFDDKDNGYYNLYYKDQTNNYSIYYEVTPFKVKNIKKIPITMRINEENNNNTILLGVNGTLYFITDYNDTEEDAFSSPDIEENSQIKTLIIDEEKNKYEVNCKLFNPKNEFTVVLCRLDGSLKNENSLITLSEINFIYNITYNVTIYSTTSIKVNQLNYRIPFIYAEKQIWYLNKKYRFEFKFKFDSYINSDIIFIYGIENDYMALENCNAVKNELTCKIDLYTIQQILTNEQVNYKLGNMNDNYGIIPFNLVYGITVIYNPSYSEMFTLDIGGLLGNVTNSGSTVKYLTNYGGSNIKLSRYFYLNFTNGEQKCFIKDMYSLYLICEIIGDGETQLEIKNTIALTFLTTTVIISPVENSQKILVSKEGAFFNYVYPKTLNYKLNSSLTIRYITPSPEKIKNIKLDLDSSSFLECENLIGMKKCTVPFEHFKNKALEESFTTSTYYLNHLNGYSPKYEIDDILVYTPEPEKINIEMNIKDEDNKNLKKVGKDAILYFVTDYFDKENILDLSILDKETFTLYFTDSERIRKYKSFCKLWRSNSTNVMLICELFGNLAQEEQIIYLEKENENFIIKRLYNVSLNYLAKNITVKQLKKELPFIYSNKYEIDLNQNVDSYSFVFNHYYYKNYFNDPTPLYLYKTNMKSASLNITAFTEGKIYCNIKKDILIEILSFSGEKFNIALISESEGLYIFNHVEIVINYKVEKKETSLSIGDLLTKSIYKNEFVIYETDAGIPSTLTTDYFDIKTNKNGIMKCLFKKSTNQDKLLFLCITNSIGESSLGKIETTSFDNINILYKFTIKESENNNIFTVYNENKGATILGVSPLLFNFSDYSYLFEVIYTTENPDGFNHIKLGDNKQEINCEKKIGYIKCSGNRDYFPKTNYYYTYHSNPLGESVISYEAPRINVILPKSINLGLIIGLSVGGAVIIAVVIIVIVRCYKKRKQLEINNNDGEELPLAPNISSE